MSKLRWTVDERADLEFVRAVYAEFRRNGAAFFMDDVLALLARKPELAGMNIKFVRDKAYIDAIEAQKKSK